MAGPPADYYAVLGVAPGASPAELRRAYRLLALQHHPDRAGQAATGRFQRITEAYAVLSDATSRAAYDGLCERAQVSRQAGTRSGAARADRAGGRRAGEGPAFEEGLYEGPGGFIGWRRRRGSQAEVGPLIERLCGALDELLARAVARQAVDGAVELLLSTAEAERGGIALIDARVTVVCPTCSGLAERHVLWCRRCEYAGTVPDEVRFSVEVPPLARDRTTFSFPTDPSGSAAPLRFRLRVG